MWYPIAMTLKVTKNTLHLEGKTSSSHKVFFCDKVKLKGKIKKKNIFFLILAGTFDSEVTQVQVTAVGEITKEMKYVSRHF